MIERVRLHIIERTEFLSFQALTRNLGQDLWKLEHNGDGYSVTMPVGASTTRTVECTEWGDARRTFLEALSTMTRMANLGSVRISSPSGERLFLCSSGEFELETGPGPETEPSTIIGKSVRDRENEAYSDGSSVGAMTFSTTIRDPQ